MQTAILATDVANGVCRRNERDDGDYAAFHDLPCLQRPVFVWFVDSVTGFKVITLIRPVPPARDCEVCGDVTCGTYEAADCPHGEDREFVP